MPINIPAKVNLNGQQFSATITLEDEQSFPAVLRHPIGTDAEIRNLLIDGEIGIVDEQGLEDVLAKIPSGIISLRGPQGADGQDGISIDYKGNWSSGIDYALNDLVRESGKVYLCLTAHQSSSGNAPSQGTGVWSLLVEDGTNAGFVLNPDANTVDYTCYSIGTYLKTGTFFGIDFEALDFTFNNDTRVKFENNLNESTGEITQVFTGQNGSKTIQLFRFKKLVNGTLNWSNFVSSEGISPEANLDSTITNGTMVGLSDTNGFVFGQDLQLLPFTYAVANITVGNGAIIQVVNGVNASSKSCSRFRVSTNGGTNWGVWRFSE